MVVVGSWVEVVGALVVAVGVCIVSVVADTVVPVVVDIL